MRTVLMLLLQQHIILFVHQTPSPHLSAGRYMDVSALSCPKRSFKTEACHFCGAVALHVT